MPENLRNLTILPQIEDLPYPLKPEELANLEASIKRDGMREPLSLWERDGESILVDGHNRYAIAQRHGIPYQTVTLQFGSLDDALDWVDKNQLGRRNLTDEERATTIGRVYQRMRDLRGAARARGGDGENEPEGQPGKRLADTVAAQWRIGSGTVKRSSDFATAIERLKGLGEAGTVAASRILSGEVRDALTELPKILKTHPDAMPLMADRIRDGATKVKDAVKDYLAMNLGAAAEEGKGDGGYGGAPGGLAMDGVSGGLVEGRDVSPNLDAMTDVGADEPGLSMPTVMPPASVSQLEIQANLMYSFSQLRPLLSHDPRQTWRELPQYVRKDVGQDLDAIAAWIGVFAAEAMSGTGE